MPGKKRRWRRMSKAEEEAGNGETKGQPPEGHSGVREPDKIKTRTCLGCRESKDKGDLVRLVAGPDGVVVIDYKGNLPGRGSYVCPKESCIREAFSRKQLQRAFKGARTEGVEEFLNHLRKKVLERVLSMLSISRKAGKVVDGREAVEKGMEKGKIILLLLAQDLSAGSMKQITEKCLRRGIKYYICLSKDEIGDFLGKGERVAVGITDKSFSALMEKEFCRLRSLGSMVLGGEINV